ncbi:prolyl oligopeptidase family serine peptidase [Testudinibacter sp. TR-2022]|uniref:prolyl oligopeptidase family serine peptidase n=1 Tax=Testudinibacter sp. TR-2022 TaxID=2585029 RepID=UPI00111B700A|nr:prolyl oligopeptidase family serine peptidase [Testudinibacter sp. TR-2022]TNH09715.1 S9 family peptidase [Pasteurellaceae bacterium Phil11]TNH23369.1 S9 family peptidase [Testudinibacter sp. TR-2022]TNH26813.1 S9 family peptidase [Testudinibacter sp. TR-2022]
MNIIRIILGILVSYVASAAIAQPLIPTKVQAANPDHVQHNDHYAWLADNRYQDEIEQIIREENRYTQNFLASEQTLRQQLSNEITSRSQQRPTALYWSDNGYHYRRYNQGYHPVFERKSTQHSHWHLIVDGAQQAENHAYYQLNIPVISPDNRLALIAEDIIGNENYQISLIHLDKSMTPETTLEVSNTSGEIVWGKNNRTFYYLQQASETGNIIGLYRHVIGLPQSEDHLIYQQNSTNGHLSISLSSSGQYLILDLNKQDGSEIYTLDLMQSNPEMTLFVPEKIGYEYYLDHHNDGFYIKSNHNNTEFELFYAKDKQAKWQTVYTPHNGSTLESFTLLKHWVIVKVRNHGVPELYYWSIPHHSKVEKIPFPDPNYLVSILHGDGQDSAHLTLRYSALNVPQSIVKFDLYQQQWLDMPKSGIHNTAAQHYQTEYLLIPVRDGISVPVTLIYKKSHFKKGKNPLLLTGYGAYGFSMQPVYGTAYRSLLDRGFVYAIAHVRGGGELGLAWHTQGSRQFKLNSIHDFIDVAQILQLKGYAAPDRTYALGESAGGLLVAAAVNQAPQLFRAVVLQVPFLDMLAALGNPATKTDSEVAEWGDISQPEEYQYIKSYSPYENIQPQQYPSILIMTAQQDQRVPFWESLKYAAKIRQYNLADSAILLNIEPHSGHSGRYGGASRQIRSLTAYTFLLKIDRIASQSHLIPSNTLIYNKEKQ